MNKRDFNRWLASADADELVARKDSIRSLMETLRDQDARRMGAWMIREIELEQLARTELANIQRKG